MGCHLAITL